MPSVGKSIPHDAALGHVTGQAPYIDDLRPLAGEFFVGFVGSPVAAGKLISIDTSAAPAIPGVVGCYTSADVPGHNMFGVVVFDEPFLADGELLYLGQPVVVDCRRFAGRSGEGPQSGAHRIARLRNRCWSWKSRFVSESLLGRCDELRAAMSMSQLAASAHRLSGKFTSGGQEQFYLESQAAIAYPGEQGQCSCTRPRRTRPRSRRSWPKCSASVSMR